MAHRRLIKHIIWDWNGTIFADSRALIEATIEAFAAAGLPPLTVEMYQRHHCQPIPVFYNRLVGRELSDDEQRTLDEHFHRCYTRQRDRIGLNPATLAALDAWSATGGTQSLLSMYPQPILEPLVRKAGIFERFSLVQGLVDGEPGRKAPHLERHLRTLGLDGGDVLLVGDSRDDGLAAQACGTACVIYHAGPDALHAREHFADLPFPVVESLVDAVPLVMSDAGRPIAEPAAEPQGVPPPQVR
jgi:phosphoglycolate phosphatase-like HAD superfamily hydrolase